MTPIGINPSAAASAYSSSQGITGIAQSTDLGNAAKSAAQDDDGVSFADLLKGSVQESLNTLRAGEEMSAKAVTGEANLTDVVQAITAAELTLQTVVAVRDRMISAYQEIMRMPI